MRLGGLDAANENVNSLGSGSVSITGNSVLQLGGSPGGTNYYTIANNITINNGIVYGQDGFQALGGLVTIGAGGATVYTEYAGKDVSITNLAGSGPLVIDALNRASGRVSTWAVPAHTRERSP